MEFDLRKHDVSGPQIVRNAVPAVLYEHGAREGDLITAEGALSALSGAKTGRSPLDKRIVDHPASSGDVWWGPVNIRLPQDSFLALRREATQFLSRQKTVYVVDGYAGWDPKRRIKIRVLARGLIMPSL